MTRSETRPAPPAAGSVSVRVRETNAPRRKSSIQTLVSSPLVATSASIRARASDTPPTAERPTTGAPAVRKVTSAPRVVPAELRATSRAW